MKRKDFFLSATAGLLTLNQVSEAQQRPGRGERGGGTDKVVVVACAVVCPA